MAPGKRDAVVKNFLKIETSTNLTDPRNISPRSDEFLCVIGPTIAAIEHRLCAAPFLVKGIDCHARDRKLSSGHRPLSSFSHFVETDYSRFDLSISLEYLQDVETVFLTANADEQFRNCYFLAFQTTGVNEIGLSYRVTGTRCSGDAHTSIANGLINHFNTWLVFQNLPPNSWVSFHEGDE